MSPSRVVAALEVVEDVLPRVVSREILPPVHSLGLERREEASITELSQPLQDRLMLQVTPSSVSSRWNGSLAYWLR